MGAQAHKSSRWVEVIRLRTAGGCVADTARELQLMLRAPQERGSACKVTICVNPAVRTDLAVFIRHRTSAQRQPEPRLGRSVADALRERGAVVHSLWRQLDDPGVLTRSKQP